MIAPDFSLADQHGTRQQLASYRGKWVVLYFYPADDTPGCTVEACSFRDRIDEFRELGVVVLGISKDTLASHKKFAEKYRLNFPILSDETGDIVRAYSAWNEKKTVGKFGVIRKTFLINPQGEIVKEYPKVNPLNHAANVLDEIPALIKT